MMHYIPRYLPKLSPLLLATLLANFQFVSAADDSSWQPKTIPSVPAKNGLLVSIASISKHKLLINAETTIREQNLDVVEAHMRIKLDAGAETVTAKAILFDRRGHNFPGCIKFDGSPVISQSSPDYSVHYLSTGDVTIAVSKERGHSVDVRVTFDVPEPTEVQAIEVAGVRFDFAAAILPLSVRQWTDIQGRKIEAKLVRVEGETAIVKMGEKEVPLVIMRLSPTDQTYLNEWKKDNPAPVSGKIAAADFVVCGTGIKADGKVTTIETRLPKTTRANILKSIERFPILNDKVTDTLVIGIALPIGFDPKRPQRVVWVGINNLAVSDEMDLRHVVAMNNFLKEATDSGWVVIAVDTKLPIPMGPGSGGEKAMRANQAAINMDVIEIFSKAWTGFNSWKFVCCGRDGGADTAQYLSGSMMRSKISLLGILVFGSARDCFEDVVKATRCKNDDYRKLKVYVSRPHEPLVIGVNRQGGPMEDAAIEARWKSRHDNIRVEFWGDGNSINTDGYKRALAWVIE